MENTINDLYLKYTNEVGQVLEDDRYFQYLYEMVQAGENTLQQKNRILHKVVDERWLSVVEDSLDAIFNIIDKPRRFIATSEEVVPVALAKKITADSVRHLSMNTQFIGTNAAGEIQPTKILNVTTEESYDLYENRFVYHLIQRLFSFVDKRTDVIFWSTGDEICNTMNMESKVDDAYEEISYKIEMTIKNRQSFAENDSDNMDVFKRIDRVRRMARALRTSSFCDIMAGCAMVRSPIQRTNLMMKDPDYRKCYQLWQFMESYDEVGYTIEERDTALEFDEEYLIQMYTNLITNYTVFKSLLESDPRKMSEIAEQKREPVKPKFIKEIKEEIVDDYNIPDVEVRKVIIEEVTQAQLDAEEKLKEETARREELENSISDLNWQLDSLNQQMQYLENEKAEAEEKLAQLQQQFEAEKAARTAAEENAEKIKTEAADAVAAARLEAEKLADTVRSEAKEIADAAQKEIAELTEEKKQTEDQLIEEKKQKEKQLADMSAELQAEKASRVQTERRAAEEKQAAEQELAEIKRTAKQQLAKEQREAEKKLAEVQKKADRKMIETKRTADQKLAEMKKEADQKLAEVRNVARQKQAEADKAAEERIAAIMEEAESRCQKAEKEKEKAIAKAEANSLSRYIRDALQERKEKKNPKEDK